MKVLVKRQISVHSSLAQVIHPKQNLPCAASQDAKPNVLPSLTRPILRSEQRGTGKPSFVWKRASLLEDGINCSREAFQCHREDPLVNHYKVTEDFRKTSCKFQTASLPALTSVPASHLHVHVASLPLASPPAEATAPGAHPPHPLLGSGSQHQDN